MHRDVGRAAENRGHIVKDRDRRGGLCWVDVFDHELKSDGFARDDRVVEELLGQRQAGDAEVIAGGIPGHVDPADQGGKGASGVGVRARGGRIGHVEGDAECARLIRGQGATSEGQEGITYGS